MPSCPCLDHPGSSYLTGEGRLLYPLADLPSPPLSLPPVQANTIALSGNPDPQPHSGQKMGRKKIQISRIGDERNRQVTFTKRKFGLMKKAYELSVLCDCEIALIIFNSANKLFQYASTDMDKVLLKYTEYNEPHESRTNKDIIEALHKKENKGQESPEVDQDPQYILTPRTEEKFQKISQDFDMMMHRNVMNNRGLPAYQSQGMTGMMPMSGHYHQGGHPGQTLMPPHTMPQQGSLSPRPNSTGGMMDLNNSNGYSSGSPNHHQMAGSPSPGMMNRSKHSPPSPGVGQRNNLRVAIPNSRSDLPVSEDGGLSDESLVDSDYLTQLGPARDLSLNHLNRSSHNSMGTPAVSMATPSMHGSGSFSGLSPFPGDFPMNSGDIHGLGNFSSSGLLSGHWSNQMSITSALQHGMNNNSMNLSVNTANHGNMSIKSEPISPPRDSTTPSSQHQLRPPSNGHMSGHVSPHHMSNHSNSSSPVGLNGGTPTDFDGPSMKRPRMAEWAAS